MENRAGHLQNCQRSDKDRAEQPIISPSLRWAVSLILAIHLGKDRQISPLHTHRGRALHGHTYTQTDTRSHANRHGETRTHTCLDKIELTPSVPEVGVHRYLLKPSKAALTRSTVALMWYYDGNLIYTMVIDYHIQIPWYLNELRDIT